MKRNLILLFFCLGYIYSEGQIVLIDSIVSENIHYQSILIEDSIIENRFIDLNLDFPNYVGKYVRNYANGEKIVEGFYSDIGRKENEWIYYYDDKIVKQNYVNGISIGLYFELNMTFNIILEGNIDTSSVFGNLYTFYFGEWKSFYDTGFLKSHGRYSKQPYEGMSAAEFNVFILTTQSSNSIGANPIAIKDNLWKYYDELGELTKIEYWDCGKLLYSDDIR